MVKAKFITRVGDALLIEGWIGPLEDLKQTVEGVPFVNFAVEACKVNVETMMVTFRDLVYGNTLSVNMLRFLSQGKEHLRSLDVIMLFHKEDGRCYIRRKNNSKELQAGAVFYALNTYMNLESKVVMAGKKAYLMPGKLEVFETIDPYLYNISTGMGGEHAFLSIPKDEVVFLEGYSVPHGSTVVSVFLNKYIGWKFDRRFKHGKKIEIFNTQKQLMDFLCR